MLTHDDEAKPVSKPGERALALAIEMVCDGRDEVGRYLAMALTPGAVLDARTRCLDRFAERPANRGVLLRALALIDGALDSLGHDLPSGGRVLP